MVDRVASDHPSVTTVRGTLVRRGGTRRPAVALPTEDRGTLPADGPVRLVVDGTERHASIASDGGRRLLAGAYDNPRLARERDGTDRLAEWVAEQSVDFGRSVLVDVLATAELYGLRLPGEEAVYEVEHGPADSLRRIAEDLES